MKVIGEFFLLSVPFTISHDVANGSARVDAVRVQPAGVRERGHAMKATGEPS